MDPKFLLLGLSLVATLGSCFACSGDDGNSNLGGIPRDADEALAQTNCYLGLAAAGVKYTGYACSGSTMDSSVSGIGPDSWDDVRMSVTLELDAPPAIGSLALSGLSLQIPKDGTATRWDASPEGCSATAMRSATEEDFGWVYYQVNIACSTPATPAEGNPGEPFELGNFTLVTFFTAD